MRGGRSKVQYGQLKLPITFRTGFILVLLALMLSSIWVLFTPHRTYALLGELLSPTVSALKNVMTPENQRVVTQPNAVMQPTQSAVAPQTSSATEQSTKRDSAVPQSTMREVVIGDPLPINLYPIQFSRGDRHLDKKESSVVVVASTKNPTSNYGIVDASEDGWRVLGLVWYWWGLVLTATVAIAATMRHLYLRRNHNTVNRHRSILFSLLARLSYQ